jgi:uncharacterized protein
VLWGTSYSGGHVVAVAARDGRVAAVIAMTPATDGLAALAQIARYAGPGQLGRATAHGLLDAARALTRRPPHHVPVVGPPGSAAIISTPGAEADYLAMAGPTWRNQVCARSALQVGLNRPIIAGRMQYAGIGQNPGRVETEQSTNAGHWQTQAAGHDRR